MNGYSIAADDFLPCLPIWQPKAYSSVTRDKIDGVGLFLRHIAVILSPIQLVAWWAIRVDLGNTNRPFQDIDYNNFCSHTALLVSLWRFA